MNFGLAFSYVFKDKDWFKKIAIPALCGLIPIVGGFVVTGWALKVTRNVIEGNVEHALPDLDFGADLGRGFKAAIITLIFSLPGIIFGSIGGAMLGSGVENDTVFLSIIGGCLTLFAILASLLIAFLGTTGMANFVAKDKFGAAFNFKETFGLLKKSFVSWLLVLLAQILSVSIIAPLGSIACGIGAILTSAYGMAFANHLLGQAYNKSTLPGVVDVEPLE
jgi:hypothetical protein